MRNGPAVAAAPNAHLTECRNERKLATTALLHRQAGLGAVERLDVRFLIDRQTPPHAPADPHRGRRMARSPDPPLRGRRSRPGDRAADGRRTSKRRYAPTT